jgi:hypothetical protein
MIGFSLVKKSLLMVESDHFYWGGLLANPDRPNAKKK